MSESTIGWSSAWQQRRLHSKPALERFHDTQANLRNQFHVIDSEEEAEEEEKKEDIDTSNNNHEGEEEKVVEQQQQQQLDKEKLKLLQEELSLASMMTGVDPDGKTSGTLERILRWDWNQEATKDEDSLPAQMRRMVTEQYFETIEGDAKKSYMLEKLMDKSFVYQDESTEITLVRSNTHVYIYMCVPASF